MMSEKSVAFLWDKLMRNCEEESAQSPAWDELEIFIERLRSLSRQKLSERPTPRDHLVSKIKDFVSKWSHAWPEAWQWHEDCCSDVDCPIVAGMLEVAQNDLNEVASLRLRMVAANMGELPAIASALSTHANNAEASRGRLASIFALGHTAKAGGKAQVAPMPPTPSDELPPVPESLSVPRAEEPEVSGELSSPQAKVQSMQEASLPSETKTPAVSEWVLPGEAGQESHVNRPQKTLSEVGKSPIEPQTEAKVEQGTVQQDSNFEQLREFVPQLSQPSEVPVEVPPYLRSFDEFSQCRWLNHERECVDAPWRREGFARKLEVCSLSAWDGERYGELWWHVKAAEMEGLEPLVDPDDVKECAALDVGESSPARLRRSGRLRQALDDSSLAGRSWLVTIFLEAVSPSDPPLDAETGLQLASLFEKELTGDLGKVVHDLIMHHIWGVNPLPRLMEKLARLEMTTEQAVAELKMQRQQFGKFVNDHRNNGGGKILHTHCRNAWRVFFQTYVEPLVTVLTPNDKEPARAVLGWDVTVLNNAVNALWEQHEGVREKYEAFDADGNRMMRLARQLQSQMHAILRVATLVQDVRPVLQNWAELPLNECRRLIDGGSFSDPWREGFRKVLVRILRPDAGRTPPAFGRWEITMDDLWQRPPLLPLLPVPGVWERGQLRQGLLVSQVPEENIRSASALCLEPAQPVEAAMARAKKLIRGRRSDLFPYYLECELLQPPAQEGTRIHEEESQMEGRLDSLRERIEALWSQLDDLAWQGAPEVRKLKDQFKSDIEMSRRSQLQRRMPLYEEWIKETVDFLAACKQTLVENLRFRLAQVGAETWTKGDRLLMAGHFAQVVELLDRRIPAERARLRLTEWRHKAIKLHPQPSVGLVSHVDDSVWEELLTLWLKGMKNTPGERQKMRRLFVDAAALKEEDTALRTCAHDAVHLHLQNLRQLFAQNGLEPDFVPQFEILGGSISILSAADAPPRGFVGAVAAQASACAREQRLPVILCPGASSQQREETIRELAARNIAAAVIDDLDMLRLLDAGRQRPKGLLALLEIILEQLSWTKVNPFQALDGHAIRLSMFVGRTEQVNELLRSAAITRIFSGRKLGKSALLKYLELSSEGGVRLSNDRILRVLYLGIGGTDKEHNVVHEIIEHMRQALGFEPSAELPADPGDRLTEHMRAFCAQRTESLLVILDEADSFVENQIKDYDRNKERSLSYRMMKQISTWQIEAGMPRVRFLFSGYRATHRVWGTWANAGSLLRLGPLDAEQAAQLIEGPLARIGVDAREQAPAIARRCGFQPAVLLRFGACLVRHLAHSHSSRCGERAVEVSSDQVAQVFNDNEVQDEIRLVTSNNFQLNRAGEVIFYSLLLRLRDLPPGDPLAKAPAEVLDRIRRIDPDVSWLKAREADCEEEIQNHLVDFVDRNLLASSKQGSETLYRLRFPHYLPVLTHGNSLENHLASLIEILRSGDLREELETSLLPAYVVNAVAARRSHTDESVACTIVGSAWPRGLDDGRSGLPSRLGVNLEDVVDLAHALDGAVVDGTVAIHAGPENLRALLGGGQDIGRPPVLIGGIDLLRAAIGAEDSESQRGRLMDVQSLGRLSQRSLMWWFERACNLQFDAPNAVGDILAVTSGMPFLVGLVDQFFRERIGSAGGDVNTSLLQDALHSCRTQEAAQAGLLIEGPAATALLPRERELLFMASRLGQYMERFVPENSLEREWPLIAADVTGLELQPYGACRDDHLALRLLLDTGFLPRDPQQRNHVLLSGDDALQRIAPHLLSS